MNDDTPFLRNHWSMVLSNTLRAGLILAFILIINVASNSGTGKEGSAILAYSAVLAVGCVLVVAYSIIIWRKTKYYFMDDEIVVLRTTIFRSETRIQYERLASVNVQRDLVCRLLDTTKLSFNLNSSVNVTRAEAFIVLKKDEAEALRSDLYDRMFKASHGSAVIPADVVINDVPDAEGECQRPRVNPLQEAEPLVDVSTFDIFLHSVFGMPTTMAVFGILMGVYSVLSFVYGGNTSLFAILIFVLEFIIPAIGTFMRYYGYRIVRVGDTVSISSGLISTRTDSFKLSKVNFVRIREPLMCRLMGRCILEAEVVGNANEKGMPLLCPLKDKKIALELFSTLLPEFGCDSEFETQSRTALAGIGMWMAIAFAFVALMAFGIKLELPAELVILLNVSVALLAVGIIGWGISAYRNRKFAMNDSIVLVVTGSFDRVYNYILIDKIQFANVRTTPLQRRRGDGRCSIHMLSAAGATMVRSGVFRADVLERVSAETLSRIRDGRYDFRKYQ